MSAEEIGDDYASSLEELTFNSKPLINSLTMIAGENIASGRCIVKAIENRLKKVRL